MLTRVLFAVVLLLTACGDGAGETQDEASDPPAAAQDLGEEPEVTVPDEPPPTALSVEDLVVGDGAPASPTSRVTVHYVGVVWGAGEEFDSSWERGAPATFPLDRVVPGFAQGIGGTGEIEPMRVGGRRQMVLPPDLAYGDQPPPGSGIDPGATLVFVVDLHDVQ